MRSYRQTGVMPPALANRPEPTLVTQFLLDAFFTLHNSRGAGFNGPSALSLSDLHAAALLFGYTSPDETYAFIKVMQALDGFYLKQESDRIKQQSKQKPK